jgi:hypothetical protein
MSLRRGERARLDAARPTATVDNPWQRLLSTLMHRRWSR